MTEEQGDSFPRVSFPLSLSFCAFTINSLIQIRKKAHDVVLSLLGLHDSRRW